MSQEPSPATPHASTMMDFLREAQAAYEKCGGDDMALRDVAYNYGHLFVHAIERIERLERSAPSETLEIDPRKQWITADGDLAHRLWMVSVPGETASEALTRILSKREIDPYPKCSNCGFNISFGDKQTTPSATPRSEFELDAQRLDWIEAKRPTVSFADEHFSSPGGPHVCAYPENPSDESNHYYGATFREALDNAMKGTNS